RASDCSNRSHSKHAANLNRVMLFGNLDQTGSTFRPDAKIGPGRLRGNPEGTDYLGNLRNTDEYRYRKMNNGQWSIREEESGLRLDYWLGSMKRLGSGPRALDALARGKIIVNEMRQTADDADRLLQTGDLVRVWMDRPEHESSPFIERQFDYLDIVHED